MTIGLLIKVGDTWIDPLAVEGVFDGEREDDEPTRPVAVVDEAQGFNLSNGWRVDYRHGGYTVSTEPPPPVCTVTTAEGDYVCEGVTADEAARLINRCREQHMSKPR